ncbi:MAG: hypothetical protein ACRDZ7_03320 [Acidimicrobiia bacterium]
MLGALAPDTDVVVVRDGPSWVIGVEPEQVVSARGEEAFAAVDGLHRGWWAGFLAYDMGRAVESVTPRIAHDPCLPDLALARFDARLKTISGGSASTERSRCRPCVRSSGTRAFIIS